LIAGRNGRNGTPQVWWLESNLCVLNRIGMNWYHEGPNAPFWSHHLYSLSIIKLFSRFFITRIGGETCRERISHKTDGANVIMIIMHHHSAKAPEFGDLFAAEKSGGGIAIYIHT
jgi:hypothetical protein